MADFKGQLNEVGEDLDLDDLQEWLDDDGGDPGYQILSDAEIVAASVPGRPEDEADEYDTDDDDDADESGSPAIPSLAHVRKTIDDLLSFTEHPDVDKSLLPH